MTWLDVALIVLLIGVAIGGYRQGFVAGIFGFAGFFAGGAVGLFVVPKLVSGLAPGALPALLAAAGALVCAGVGQALGSLLGVSLRRFITWKPARAVDAGAGAVLSLVSVLILVWVFAYAVAQGPVSPFTDQVRSSKVLGAIDRVMPDAARGWFSDFRATLARSSFPQVFSAIAPPPIVNVPAPDEADVDTAAVRRAALSSVEVVGDAPSCDRRISGSGFFYSPHHVLTNAHVVAGTDDVSIRLGGVGASWPARVVAIDRQRDVAVLYVPGVTGSALRFDTDPPHSGDPTVVIGYPEGGPLTLRAARVRNVQEARGQDIDDSGLVTREILALRTIVQPGNSGGPLVAVNGSVEGVVFAASVVDAETGYALTVREVAPVANAGSNATSEVSTGACVAD